MKLHYSYYGFIWTYQVPQPTASDVSQFCLISGFDQADMSWQEIAKTQAYKIFTQQRYFDEADKAFRQDRQAQKKYLDHLADIGKHL